MRHRTIALLAALLLPSPALAQWPGKICRVTTLADSGPGSYRDCASQSGNRSIVFETSGAIFLKSALTIVNPGMRTYCQTGKGPVEFRNAAIAFSAAHLRMEHCTIAPGDGPGGVGASNPSSRDAAQVSSYGQADGSVFDVVLKNCSLRWGVDENASVWGTKTHDVTYENCLIAEALGNSIHPKGFHSMGFLVNPGGKGVVLKGNLFVHNHDRNFRAEEDTQGIAYNNVFYNQGGISCWNGMNLSSTASKLPPKWDLWNNVWKYGLDTPKQLNCPPVYGGSNVPTKTLLFVKGNLGGPRTSLTQDEWAISGLPTSMRSQTPLFPLPDDITPTEQLEAWIEANVGATPWARTAQDKRIINEWRTGTGRIKDCLSGCANNVGGWEAIPELRHTLNPPTTEPEFAQWIKGFERPLPELPPFPTPNPNATATPTPEGTAAPTATVTPAPTLPPMLTPTPFAPVRLDGYVSSRELSNGTVCAAQFREPTSAADATRIWVDTLPRVRELSGGEAWNRAYVSPDGKGVLHVLHDHSAGRDESYANFVRCRDAFKKTPKTPVLTIPPEATPTATATAEPTATETATPVYKPYQCSVCNECSGGMCQCMCKQELPGELS